MRFSLIWFITVVALRSLSAQDIVVFTDGKKTAIKDFKLKNMEISITLENKAKQTPTWSDIDCICQPEKERTLFPFISYDYLHFMDRKVEGNVNLYENHINGGNKYGAASTIFTLEKHGRFTDLEFSLIRDNELTQKVIDFLRDDTSSIRLLESPKFRLNGKTLVNSLINYNLNQFVKTETSKSSKGISTVIFYFASGKVIPETSARLILNDSTKLQIDRILPLAVNLPVDNLTKVCLNNNDQQLSCNIVRGSYCYIKYIEIDILNSGAVTFKEVHSRYAKSKINYNQSMKK
jgi:hypothetical protein